MGCDGGTIPKRDELVRTKKKSEQKDKVSELAFLWRDCSISQTPLKKPIVACGLGRLYNKDAVILGVLDKSTLPESAKHIKSIKDVKELNLTTNPAFIRVVDKGDSYIDHQSSPYICPVIGLEMNGKFKFCFYWNCGCVVSERAIKEVKSNLCGKCGESFSENDIVIINATSGDLDLNKIKMDARVARKRAERKEKKDEKCRVLINGKEEGPKSEISMNDKKDEQKTEVSFNEKTRISTKHEAGPSKIVATTSEKNGIKRSAVGLGLQTADFKKTKGDYSVATDPTASSVYKSLFTSSNQARNQSRAHWITYNPFYN